MIGQAIDHLVGWFNPQAAAKRVNARNVYTQLLKRGYDAAKLDRSTVAWNTSNSSPDLELSLAAATIRSRARDLVRNNAYARGILRARVRNVIGCGIIPQARISDPQGEPLEQINQQIEDLFERWSKVADATGRLTFYEIQRLAYQEVDEAGECLIHFTTLSDDRGRPVSLALELIDADRLADEWMGPRVRPGENEVRRGVEVDPLGRPVAYWIYPHHPSDVTGAYSMPVRMPANEFIHLYRCERIGQTRGVSLFAPVVTWLKHLGYYVENELQASAVASCFSVVVKTLGGGSDGALLASSDTSNTDTDGNRFEYLQPGMVSRLMPGEEIETVNPGRPNASADAWINLILRSIAVGAGLSYERLARDYTQTNYSSARASDLEDRKEFRTDQDWIRSHLCEPVWQRFIESAVLEGKLPITSEQLIEDYDGWTSHTWQTPGWEWVDPVKEATASQLALQSNLTTLSEELGSRGRDLHDTLRQLAREKQLKEDLGLSATDEPETDQEMEDDGEERETAAASAE